MNTPEACRLDIARRDAGAGIVAAATAFVGALLYHGWALLYQPGPVDVERYVFETPSLAVFTVVVGPVVASVVGALVWRSYVPAEPRGKAGAIAGVLTAFGTLLGLATVLGVLASGGAAASAVGTAGVVSPLFVVVEAVGTFSNIVFVVVVFGSLLAGPIITPLGALVGWGYERIRATRQ